MTQNEYLKDWQAYVESALNNAPVEVNETVLDKQNRIKKLEADPEAWFKYYFSKNNSEPAKFHKASTKRIINNPEWYEVRMWSRELAKSTRTMYEVLYLCLVGHPIKNMEEPPVGGQGGCSRLKKRYCLLVSNSFDNAVRLLMPYKAELQLNPRLINDYGQQERPGSWTDSEFTTTGKFAFRAIGTGQSPRGTRNGDARPDIILFDDVDTDEDCRNPEMIDKTWKWIEEAAIGTRGISTKTTIIFCGNRIAVDCCVVRAIQFCDKHDEVNIVDKNGESSWKEKNSQADVERVKHQKSWAAFQKEYMNNPIVEGAIFKEITWADCPPLSKFPYIVGYADPATSNKDKGSGMTGASYKALVLVGEINFKYYVITAYLDQVSNAHFVDWFYAAEQYVENQCKGKAKTQLFNYQENNPLQDPFYEQVFKPLFHERSKIFGKIISIIPDTTKKPDKFVRIEGTLEPLNRNNMLIFNIKEKDNPHMQRLASQLLGVSPTAKVMDGPDALQGAVAILNTRRAATGAINIFTKPPNKHRIE